VLVEVGLVLGEDSAQVRGVDDEDPVEDLAACTADPALHDRVHPRCLRSGQQYAQALAPEYLIEHAGELTVPVSDQEFEVSDALTQLDRQVPGLLGHPGAGRVGGDPEDADTAGGVLDDGKAIQAGQGDGVDGEEVAGQDSFRLGIEELPPGRAGSAGCRVDACLLQDRPYGGRGDHAAELGQLTSDPPVSPGWVLSGHLQYQLADRRPDRRTPGLPAPVGPASFHQVGVPAQQCSGSDEHPEAPSFRQQSGQC
jgi:hypothetical protein